MSRSSKTPHDYTPPNSYASAEGIDLTPDLDPRYDPKTGVPADGYSIAVALAELQREQAAIKGAKR